MSAATNPLRAALSELIQMIDDMLSHGEIAHLYSGDSKRLEQARAALAAPESDGWLPIEKAEPDTRFLCVNANGHRFIARYHSRLKMWVDDFDLWRDPKKFRPLPPPKE